MVLMSRTARTNGVKSIDVVVFVLITAATIGVCISRVHIVRHSIIDGRFVMRDRVIPGIDEAALRDQAQAYYEAAVAGYEVTLVEKDDKLGGKALGW